MEKELAQSGLPILRKIQKTAQSKSPKNYKRGLLGDLEQFFHWLSALLAQVLITQYLCDNFEIFWGYFGTHVTTHNVTLSLIVSEASEFLKQ